MEHVQFLLEGRSGCWCAPEEERVMKCCVLEHVGGPGYKVVYEYNIYLANTWSNGNSATVWGMVTTQ